jgi:hypothetical protein
MVIRTGNAYCLDPEPEHLSMQFRLPDDINPLTLPAYSRYASVRTSSMNQAFAMDIVVRANVNGTSRLVCIAAEREPGKLPAIAVSGVTCPTSGER